MATTSAITMKNPKIDKTDVLLFHNLELQYTYYINENKYNYNTAQKCNLLNRKNTDEKEYEKLNKKKIQRKILFVHYCSLLLDKKLQWQK